MEKYSSETEKGNFRKWTRGLTLAALFGVAGIGIFGSYLNKNNPNENNFNGNTSSGYEQEQSYLDNLPESQNDSNANLGGLEQSSLQSSEKEENVLSEFDPELVKMLIKHEGFRNWVYDDETGKRLHPGEEAKGNRTVGVGRNLEGGPRGDIGKLGYNYQEVLRGEEKLEDDDVKDILAKDIRTAKKDAKSFLGEKYNQIDPLARMVVIDMAFNLGYDTLEKFKGFKEALINENYERAAMEMKYRDPENPSKGKTPWFNQTGDRAEENYSIMRNIGNN